MRYRILFFFIFIFSLMFWVGCVQTQFDVSTMRPEIQMRNQAFMDAFNGGDAAAMAIMYTEDGQLLPPNGEIVTGREGIQGFWQFVMDMGIKTATLETVELFGGQDSISEIGKFSLGDGDGNELDHGKYIVIWKPTDDGWKLHRDIWNSSVPLE